MAAASIFNAYPDLPTAVDIAVVDPAPSDRPVSSAWADCDLQLASLCCARGRVFSVVQLNRVNVSGKDIVTGACIQPGLSQF